MYRKTSFVTVFGDYANAVGLDDGADERVNVVVTNFPHQAHLFHSLATNFPSFGEDELFGSHYCSSVGGYFSEHLIHCHTRQTDLHIFKNYI